MTGQPRRRKDNRRKLLANLSRKDGKQPPKTIAPIFGPGTQVQFRVSVDGPNVVISMNLPVLTMVTTPKNVRQFAAALVAAAEKAERNEQG